uniref:Uncharacterized protein n=1 Tax=Vombatus ursinus TaxID=29139 RepID=A0A4X2K876_VOMUR
MEQVSGLLSWALSGVLWLLGGSERGAARQLEEKALELDMIDIWRKLNGDRKEQTIFSAIYGTYTKKN